MPLDKYKFNPEDKLPAINANSIDPDNRQEKTAGYLTGGTGISSLGVFEALATGANDGKVKITVDGVEHDDVPVDVASYSKIFLTTGTSWTVPAGLTSAMIECIGGGGSGGGSSSSATFGGGGGGAYAKKNSLALTPGEVITYQVGNAGQDTWFKSTATVLAKGGSSGSGNTGGLGGAAANCVGDVKYSGGNGANGDGTYGGAGGGAAGPHGAGLNGTGPGGTGGVGGKGDNGYGGNGGQQDGTPATMGTQWDATHGCGGGGGRAGNGGASVSNGALYGGGGGGGGNYSFANGTGAKGLIVITYAIGGSYNDIAASFQTALRAATGGNETVVFDTDKFKVTSGTVGIDSQVLKLKTPTSGTDVSGAGAIPYLDMADNAIETPGLGDEYSLVRLDNDGQIPIEVLENSMALTQQNTTANILIASEADISTNSTSYIKGKEIVIGQTGSYYIGFTISSTGSVSNAWADAIIYKNGVAVGTTRSVNNVSGAFYETLSFNKGDLLQVYYKCRNASYVAHLQQLRVYGFLTPPGFIVNS